MRNEKILTIDARNNIFLEVMQNYFKLDHNKQYALINRLFHELLEVLSLKGINYYDLSKALIPNPDRNEAVFVFDTTLIKSFSYRRDIFKKIIPLFDKRSSHSILCGDYIGDNEHQDKLFYEFSKRI